MDNVESSSVEECYNKLVKLKEIRQRTIQVERMKNQIKDHLHGAVEEGKAVDEYKREVGLLLQEKMAHVEELRLIHTDINTMENLIKQASMDRGNMLSEANKLLQHYKVYKRELDGLRGDLDLEKSVGLEEEEPDLISEMTVGAVAAVYEVDKSITADPAPFESQDKLHLNDHTSHPPPMKMCLSCHQQIHRNAPICPLCKAKSRSRNPKKPKKSAKTED